MERKYLFIPALTVLFAVFILASIPKGAVFGSHTDWLSQHVTLAETIRNACLEQRTLLPSWIELGGGSNGYMFSYYGFLRPDILIGCLLPHTAMLHILTGYMLATYLASVLLCFVWLRSEGIRPAFAFMGSVLFMTAGCLFHMHRQIMFVNYLPFLLAAFLCIRRKYIKLLPLFLCLICLSSFYFSISEEDFLSPLCADGLYCRRNVRRTAHPHGTCPYGAQTGRHGRNPVICIGAFRPESGDE